MTFITIPNRPVGTAARSIEQLLADFDAVTAGIDSFVAKRKLLLSAQGYIKAGVNDTQTELMLPFRGACIPNNVDVDPTTGTYSWPPPVWIGDYNHLFSLSPDTTRFRIKATIATNTVAPTKSFTVVLSKLTGCSGANQRNNWATSQQSLAYTAPQVVTPSASSITNVESAEYSPLFTDSSCYLFTVVLSATGLAAGAVVGVRAELYYYCS